MDFVPIYSDYACMRRLYIGAKYESRLAWRKHPHLPIFSAKRGKIVPLWLRTYFRGGTVLYRVGALEGTTFFRIVQIFPNFIVYLK